MEWKLNTLDRLSYTEKLHGSVAATSGVMWLSTIKYHASKCSHFMLAFTFGGKIVG